jgi:glycosyltransferase involved in cell wall biosynthesis
MKIAFITHEPFYPPSGGGSAEAIYLVQEFVSRGHEVHLFGPAIADAEQVQQKFGIVLHQFTRWAMGRYTSWRSFKYLLYPSAIQRMVEEEGQRAPYDLIFSQHAISAVAAGRLGQKLQTRVVMNFLDYLSGFMETWPRHLAPRSIVGRLKTYELSLPNRYGADGVLTVSDTLTDCFAHVGYPRERIRAIYYGYDSSLFPLRADSVAERANKVPTIVMHGSLDHHHLKDIALDAMIFVVQNRPDAVFKFVGQETATLRSFLDRVGRRIPGTLVECTGFVPYEEMAQHLSEAAIGIVPYEESIGTHCAFVAKIVEYLAVGLPVVSTPLGSAVRYFGDELMVRFSGFDGISFGRKTMSWLLDPPHMRQRLARAASERVRRNLDWKVVSSNAVDFVEWICQLPRDEAAQR